ncbi:hypothetical protein DPMN_047069 [Dreissena polymorpha]|uniref:Uncharacterized protein n=1 Tax=Dreissena polymorpha TaxID=45954 RepID=A0A9D4I160_DREPO|nr:hypothetical protein DPMN_047069 [Dreissena polymorpha]
MNSSTLRDGNSFHADGMTRAFYGAIFDGGSEPDVIDLDAAIRIIENILATGGTNSNLVKTLDKLINLRDVVKKIQLRNGYRAKAELNSERISMENEWSLAQGQDTEPSVAVRDFHNRNCFKLGQICGFTETPAARAIQSAAKTRRSAASGFPAAKISN